MERLISNESIKRLLLAVTESINDSMITRDGRLVDGVREHLLAPALRQAYRDLLPYAWGGAALVAVLVSVVLVILVMQLVIFWRLLHLTCTVPEVVS